VNGGLIETEVTSTWAKLRGRKVGRGGGISLSGHRCTALSSSGRWWRYYRNVDRNLASIRDERAFKSIFSDVERARRAAFRPRCACSG
jgi:hypothetical protein